MSQNQQKILELIKTAGKMHKALIYDVEFKPLKVYIDKAEGEAANINLCEQVLVSLLFLLRSEGLEDIDCEVSTPGLERKLKKDWHFRSALGKKIKIYTKEPIFWYKDNSEAKQKGLKEAPPKALKGLPAESTRAKSLKKALSKKTLQVLPPLPPKPKNQDREGLEKSLKKASQYLSGRLLDYQDHTIYLSEGERNLKIPLNKIAKAHVVFEPYKQKQGKLNNKTKAHVVFEGKI